MSDDAKYKDMLTPEQYQIMRQKGTEAPFSGQYWNNHENGMYECAACGAELFSSETKFDSGTGWPSFSDVARSENVILQDDNDHGMHRTEVVCAKCGGHLGHLFADGPKDKGGPTSLNSARSSSAKLRGAGSRYCINSACLNFKAKK